MKILFHSSIPTLAHFLPVVLVWTHSHLLMEWVYSHLGYSQLDYPFHSAPK